MHATPANMILLFPISPQMKDSPVFEAYLMMRSRIRWHESLEDLGRIQEPPALVYLTCCFEELGTLGEPAVAGLMASAATFLSYLAKFGQGTHPVVVLDVPQLFSPAEMIQQLALRNYFAQTLLDSGAVRCVLATGLRPADSAMQAYDRVMRDLSSGPTKQVDLLRDITGIRGGPLVSDTLFTRNPLQPLTAGVAANA
jgi:hypothetical protein